VNVDVKVTGAAQVEQKLEAEVDRAVNGFQAAVFQAGGVLASEAMDRAPYLTGYLRESRYVKRTMPVEIGFAAEHAHLTHERGPRKKYLQLAMSEQASRVEPVIARLTEKYRESGTTLQTVASDHPDKPRRRSRKRPPAPPRRSG
jgi:hypothetical protein